MTSTSTVLTRSNESVSELLQFAKLEMTHRNLISASQRCLHAFSSLICYGRWQAPILITLDADVKNQDLDAPYVGVF